MADRSAGLLVWTRIAEGPAFLLAHPGGPYWRSKDAGAWTIPKGVIQPGEDGLTAARREFFEETGLQIDGEFLPLEPVRQKAGKWVDAWAFEARLSLRNFSSISFEMEWPRRSGRIETFPEVDRIGYFLAETAKLKILEAQRPFIDQVLDYLRQEDEKARNSA